MTMSLDTRLDDMQGMIRREPAVAGHRWALFQLLCVTEQWERAIQQLQVFAQLNPQQAQAAQAYRELIRAERWRAKVMSGLAQPGFVVDPPSWIESLAEALRLTAAGQAGVADTVREAALDQAPLVSGSGAARSFEWIADSDSRLGPVCEVITAGRYRWLPFSDIAGWEIGRPATLVDLVWAPCSLTLVDGTKARGFMPARFPAVTGAVHDCAALDALRLGNTTVWTESGRTGVIAQGRKTWATSSGDVGVFELDVCAFSDDANRVLADSIAGSATQGDGGMDGTA
ncbi:type VI secretion system accessory protein TagJ [Paraburkholderia lycopersici]|uniref:Type VI secretion system protein ImpE n=1 Tax=Paraburkholderia lycopersici TaxID=416944 RepID=A0A1G7CUD1_9BURK|nr:type VI secretion system accessory protein TagJ [Paraburkholderia lycopersici]SDE42831.1 type VI secretion system protein ImpE [Paraburkholderia lycopersici]